MLEKKIKYLDYNDVEREETFYFNIRKDELLMMDLYEDGGMQSALQRIIEEKDYHKILDWFNKMIDASFGRKSPDGKYFEKKPEYVAQFKSTNAYEILIMELLTEEGAGLKFISAIMPPELVRKAQPELAALEVVK